jgi:hypothetical protein
MPCLVCKDARRPEIEISILQKVPLREVANTFGFSKSLVHRHTQCMAAASRVKAGLGSGLADAQDETVTRLRRLYLRCEHVLRAAERKGNLKVAGELLSRMDDLQKRMTGIRAKSPTSREVTIRVVYEDPPDCNGAELPDLLAQAISFYGWARLLGLLLKHMAVGEKSLSARLRAETMQFLSILQDDYPEVATNVEGSR